MPEPINISASRGASILGVNQWKTPVESWLEICESRRPGFAAENGYKLPEPPDNAAIRWGKAFEDSICELAQSEQNKDIILREKLYKKGEFLTCHIDGMFCKIGGNSTDKDYLHEGKTTTIFSYREKWGEPGTDRIPREYMIQVQHQMMCTGKDRAVVSVLVFPNSTEDWEKIGHTIIKDADGYLINNEKISNFMWCKDWAHTLSQMGYFHQYEIAENKELQDLMIEKYTEFWQNNVLKETPPEITDYEDIKLLCPEPSGTIVVNEQVEKWAAEYKDITKEIGTGGDLSKRKKQLKVLILDYCRQYDNKFDTILDDDSLEKFIIRDRSGKKLFQYNGKVMR